MSAPVFLKPAQTCAAALMLAVMGGCANGGDPDSPLRVAVQTTGGRSQLQLVALPGYRINASIPPSLETADTVIRFAGPLDPADSLYFAGAATAPCPSRGRVRGVVLASVCAANERVCRTARAKVSLRCDA